MNAAYQLTVTWLPELAPTLEARRAALATYRQQCNPASGSFVLYTDEELGVWGFIGRDAVLLFAIPPEAPQAA